MEKLKVYLDTSVISYLSQKDSPEKMAETLELWEEFKKGKFDVFLSRVTLDEIDCCPEPKRTFMLGRLKQIEFSTIETSKESVAIARKIIELKILTEKSFDDCRHIGAAISAGCDCILSWNFRHLVNVKTIRGIRAITSLENYKAIEIFPPSVLLGKEA